MNRRDVPGGANTGEVIPTHFRWKGTFAQGSQARWRGPDVHKGHPIGINLSREVKQEAERSVGARADDVGLGGPLGSPAGWGGSRVPPKWKLEEQGRGRRKRPNPTSSSTPAPTDADGLFLG